MNFTSKESDGLDDADWLGAGMGGGSTNSGDGDYDGSADNEDSDENIEDDKEWSRRMEQKKVFAEKTGRGWDDTWEIPEVLSSTLNYEDLPDWEPKYVSKISLERVQLHPDKIPSISKLARIPLPLPPHPHPGHGLTKAYGLHRNRILADQVSEAARALAKPEVERIQKLPTFDEKQNAVDALFENVEFKLKRQQVVLGRLPSFGKWVEQALETYLKEVEEQSKETLYQSVLATVQTTMEEEITRIGALGKPEEKQAAAKALFESLESQVLEANPTTNDHSLFSLWVQKAVGDALSSLKKSANDALLEELSPVVRKVMDAEGSLHIANIEDEGEGKRAERLLKVAEPVKKELEMETVFEALPQFSLVNWMGYAHKEFLYTKVISAVQPKLIDGHDESKLTKIIVNELEKEGFYLAPHQSFKQWVKNSVVRCLETKGSTPEFTSKVQFPSDSELPVSVVSYALQQFMNDRGETAPDEDQKETGPYPTREQDMEAVPMYMDIFNPDDELEENAVPTILAPLKFEERQTQEGRMIEEWELAAHKETKRIMIRQCTRKIAQVLDKCETEPKRVFVHGKLGVGKTAMLAALVASARKSGHIVMFLPDLNTLRKEGYYVEPCPVREGLYVLPILSQQLLQLMLETHQEEIKQFSATREMLKAVFTEDQMEKVPAGDSFDLAMLAGLAGEQTELAPGCYDTVMNVLMTQEEKPFTIILDEFNSLYKPGEYFHETYDPKVRKPIPYEQINLFKPMMDAMALSQKDDGELILEPILMKNGAIIAATSESHAVARKITDLLIENAKFALKTHKDNFVVMEVPRLSKIEVEHTVANYEATGMGSLRFDKGKTVMNPQEMEYLRLISSAVPRHLLDFCVNFE